MASRTRDLLLDAVLRGVTRILCIIFGALYPGKVCYVVKICAQRFYDLRPMFFQCIFDTMDYKSFEKAMDRAEKALLLNDTERCMKIMQSIIHKFDTVR